MSLFCFVGGPGIIVSPSGGLCQTGVGWGRSVRCAIMFSRVKGGGGEWGGVFKRPDYDRKTAADLS